MTRIDIEKMCKEVIPFSGDECSMCIRNTAWIFIGAFKEDIKKYDITYDEIENWVNSSRDEDDYMWPLISSSTAFTHWEKENNS